MVRIQSRSQTLQPISEEMGFFHASSLLFNQYIHLNKRQFGCPVELPRQDSNRYNTEFKFFTT